MSAAFSTGLNPAPASRPTEVFAPAKINLALHVTGQRADGYHLLDSLVAFANVGDRLVISASEDMTLAITGPRAAGLPVAGNLVMRAAEALRNHVGRSALGAAIRLEKLLPPAAGIGGGSSDAGAALRGLNRHWQLGLSNVELALIGAGLGADIPVCVHALPARMQGIGEILTPIGQMPEAWLVLVNPGFSLSTPAVFASLQSRQNAPLPPLPDGFSSAQELARWLAASRNDLEAAAIMLQPAIFEVRDALAASRNCLIARMSGSGATCFGLYSTQADAMAACGEIAAKHAAWWCEAAALGASGWLDQNG